MTRTLKAFKVLVALGYLFAVGSLALGITALMLGVIPAPIAAAIGLAAFAVMVLVGLM